MQARKPKWRSWQTGVSTDGTLRLLRFSAFALGAGSTLSREVNVMLPGTVAGLTAVAGAEVEMPCFQADPA